MNKPQRTAICICIAVLAAFVGGCGGGGSSSPPPVSNDPPPPPPPPLPEAPEKPIVYLADQDTDEVNELYLVDDRTPGVSVKINAPLEAGGEITSFELSPDMENVAYVASDSLGVAELYFVDLADPGTSTKLNSPLVANGDVLEFRFSPDDGTQVAYLADQEVDQEANIYLVDVANPGVSTLINSPLPAAAGLTLGFRFSPDGAQVLYAADVDIDEVFELFLTEIATPGVATKVNAPFDSWVNLAAGFGFSPDGATVAYMADQDADGLRELYAVAVNALGVSAKLNSALVVNGDVCRFKFSPDSTRVAYCADQDVDEKLELHLLDIAVPGVTFKVNADLVAGGDVSATTWAFGPDSNFVVYRADQEADEEFELYRVETAAPGVAVKINSPMVAGGDSALSTFGQPSFSISPDGLKLSYIADQDTDEIFDLYVVDMATPGVSAKLNPPTTFVGAFFHRTSADSLQVFYQSIQDNDFVELYRVDIAAPGVSTTINSSLTAGGGVRIFLISPGGVRIAD